MFDAIVLKVLTDCLPSLLASIVAARTSRWLRSRRVRRRDI
jgi:hypothetical protein